MKGETFSGYNHSYGNSVDSYEELNQYEETGFCEGDLGHQIQAFNSDRSFESHGFIDPTEIRKIDSDPSNMNENHFQQIEETKESYIQIQEIEDSR